MVIIKITKSLTTIKVMGIKSVRKKKATIHRIKAHLIRKSDNCDLVSRKLRMIADCDMADQNLIELVDQNLIELVDDAYELEQ